MNIRKPPYMGAIKDGDLGVPPPPEAPDSMELAAWLDGHMSESQAAAVESALCRDGQLRRALLELDEVHPQPLPPAEQALARALVGSGQLVCPGPDRHTWFARVGFPLSVGAMACVLVICGFALGAGFAADVSAQRVSVMAQTLSDLLPL